MSSEENEIKNNPPKEQSITVAAILIAALIIAGSVFYNTKLILNKIDKGATLGAANPTPTPSQQAAVVNVPVRADAPTFGNKNAKVTIVEFSDFQCPYCARFFKETFGQLKSKYIDTGKVKFIFRHYPLPSHQAAQKAAEAAECAARQDKFEPYHNFLFIKGQGDGSGLSIDDLKKYAADLGLNTSQFNQCLDNGQTASAVSQDLKDGQAAGVSGTPTFFINGQKTTGALPFSVFEQLIEEALKK